MESPTEPVAERRQRKLESTAARTFESYFQRSAKARSIGDVPDTSLQLKWVCWVDCGPADRLAVKGCCLTRQVGCQDADEQAEDDME